MLESLRRSVCRAPGVDSSEPRGKDSGKERGGTGERERETNILEFNLDALSMNNDSRCSLGNLRLSDVLMNYLKLYILC
jgi:hypothetical protein